jgi:hypothetical protein
MYKIMRQFIILQEDGNYLRIFGTHVKLVFVGMSYPRRRVSSFAEELNRTDSCLKASRVYIKERKKWNPFQRRKHCFDSSR